MKIIIRLLLATTAFSPVFLVCAFLEAKRVWDDAQKNDFSYAIILVAIFFLSLALCCGLIKLARSQKQRQKFSVSQIKPADYELIGFVMVYAFPFLITTGDMVIDIPILISILIFFIAVIFVTNAYHFNPTLGLLGYHFFEVSRNTSGGVMVFTLISSRKIKKLSEVAEAAQLTEYIFLDTTRKEENA